MKAKALRLLAQREHSRGELERKLMSRAYRAAAGTRAAATGDESTPDAEQLQAEIGRALDELEQHGLLSDARTADALLLGKSARYGSRRLKQMLQAKSLDPALVSSTLARAHDSEFERAHAIWQRRFGEAPGDLRERARQQRFLAGRGFDSAVIERVFKLAPRTPASDRRGDPELD